MPTFYSIVIKANSLVYTTSVVLALVVLAMLIQASSRESSYSRTKFTVELALHGWNLTSAQSYLRLRKIDQWLTKLKLLQAD